MNDYAPLYRFLAHTFLRPPGEEMLEPAADLLDAPFEPPDGDRHAWLFDFNVYPYASVYLDPSGMLNAPWSGFVAGVYRALELEVALDAGLAAPDHISAQLEALAALLEREEASNELAAERARHAQKTLLAEHLLPWLPAFSFAVERLESGVYGQLAELARALAIEHLEGLLGDAPAPFFMFPKAEEIEQSERARDELAKFISPARSGMFLSREDILRLGRRLELPVRFAERAFMLEQLALAAADAERLDAFFLELRAEAEQHLERLRQLQQGQGRLAPLWAAQCVLLEESVKKLSQLQREVTLPGS